MKNIIIVAVAVAVIFGAGGFYGGIKYAKSNVPAGFSRSNFNGLSQGDSQQRSGARMGSGGFIAGEVVSKDDKSITLKVNDGGSKIVFYSDSTEIQKSIKGSVDDLEAGKTISVSGTANQDGSITAKTIQAR
jgi:cytochrome c-type biogenesis protein CcmE